MGKKLGSPLTGAVPSAATSQAQFGDARVKHRSYRHDLTWTTHSPEVINSVLSRCGDGRQRCGKRFRTTSLWAAACRRENSFERTRGLLVKVV